MLVRLLDSTGHGEWEFDAETALEDAKRKFGELNDQGDLQALVVEKKGGAAKSTDRLVPGAYEHIFLRQLVAG